MTFHNRKTRRAADAAGRRKDATGGRPSRDIHITRDGACPPGAPCCEATEADRLFFETEPRAKTLLRERIIGEFGEMDALAERLYGPRFRVVVVKLDDGHRTRQPITRNDADELARALDAICDGGRA